MGLAGNKQGLDLVDRETIAVFKGSGKLRLSPQKDGERLSCLAEERKLVGVARLLTHGTRAAQSLIHAR